MLQQSDYIWCNGQFIRWNEATVHVLTPTLHYGGGAFEGIRAYQGQSGLAVFRLREHIERLCYSCGVVGIKLPFSVEQISEAVVELLRKNGMQSCYIRPLAYYGYGVMGLKPFGAPPQLMIACWPWGAYLPHKAVDLKISRFIRVHERSTVVDAKICGHYVNSMLAVLEIVGTKYHEALLLDARGYIAEGPGENFFIVEGSKLVTPKRGTILPGITRDTVMRLAPHLALTVEEGDISVDRALAADEAFLTGTAAEVVAVRSLNDAPIGPCSPGPVSERVCASYLDLVHGRSNTLGAFLTRV